MSDSEGQTIGSSDTYTTQSDSQTVSQPVSQYSNPTSDSLVLEEGGPTLRSRTSMVQRFCGRVSNPTEADFTRLKAFAETATTYFVCGPIETCSFQKNSMAWISGPETTPHCHFYFETARRQRWTAFQKPNLLGLGYHLENARESGFQCTDYCLKGSQALHLCGRMGEVPGTQTRQQAGQAVAPVGTQAKKDKLTVALESCSLMKDFIREHPALYVRNCHGIRELYLQKIRETAMVRPIAEWHFGATRSGKTYTGLKEVGGMDNPLCHYQTGNLDWMKGNYMGESILFLNEFRHSNMEAFTNLLTILEGYRAEMPMKGSFVPIRCQRVIITCPRPPQALTVMTPQGPVEFGGEFESVAKNSLDNAKVAWEDAAQVTERIAEVGGKIIYHYRRRSADDPLGWDYFQLDVTAAALRKARRE